jgi:hypothetical protein
MELIMKTDLAKAIPQAIEFNYDELKAQLPERLTYYNNLVVTEESIKSAKADKATLNKLLTAFEDARKEVKRDCLKPYEDFNSKESELAGMIREAVTSIDSQVKTFDEQKKAEKRERVVTFYADSIGNLDPLVTLDKVWEPRWMNATYKMADIEKEITDIVFKVKNNISIIKAFDVGCEQQMLDVYLKNLDFSAAIAEKTRWEEQQKRLKEYEESQKKAREETEHKAAAICTVEPASVEEKAAAHDYIEAQIAESTHIPEPDECPPMQKATKTIQVEFRDTTADFRHEMRNLCDKYGIAYGWAK